MQDFINGILRPIGLLFDLIIYRLVEMIYNLFTTISNVGVFTQDNLNDFAGRIYVLLGVFMLFKVSFSLITYILNPDDLMDKNKGVSKLLTNFFVVLIGIVAVPYIFQAAFSLQKIVLQDNIIGNFIMGTSSNSEENKEYINKAGQLMAHTSLSVFASLNDTLFNESCSNHPVIETVNENGEHSFKINDACDSGILQTRVDNGDTIETNLINSYKEKDVAVYFDTNLLLLKAQGNDDKNYYIFDYSPFISTISGVLIVLVLLSFCFDIALRSVKLGFLQLIAPIPIISYIDPKSGKDGIFKKWTKECVKTYFDLFVRLIAIYFAIYVISIIGSLGVYDVTTEQPVNSLLVQLFIMFGALLFAKQLPDLISNITGIKLNGTFTINPINKLQQVPVVGWGTSQITGRAAGAITAARYDQTGNKWKAAISGWFGAGDALHGKVPMMGIKPGGQTFRSMHTGMETGFEIATGSKMKKRVPFSKYFAEQGQEEIENLKKNYRIPLYNKLNNLNLQKQEVANSYNLLQEKLKNTTDPEERKKIQVEIQAKQKLYQELSGKAAGVQVDINVISDQIKDLERAYNIDKSPSQFVDNIKAKVDNELGRNQNNNSQS